MQLEPRSDATIRKPIVFFSHSSKDAEALRVLKASFADKVGGVIDVFLSSDGQSIPLGRNWVHRIEQALNEAKLLVTFITPNSADSTWVSFEAGFAYSKGVRVVPVGFLGLDVAKVPPPLGLLQGFNITSADGLDNLTALINDVLDHKHQAKFTADEYKKIIACAERVQDRDSPFSTFIDEVLIRFEKPGEQLLGPQLKEIAEAVANLIFPGAPVWWTEHRSGLHFPGGDIRIEASDSARLTLDPLVVDRYADAIHLIGSAIKAKSAEYEIYLYFVAGVTGHDDRHKISALIPEIELGNEKLEFEGLPFGLNKISDRWRILAKSSGSFPVLKMRSLVELLAERQVIWFNASPFDL